ncbi:MAG: TrmH family RNA methyltransferase [Bacteroidota bacterium]|nr:TrmH family RNA methyltransferase [Bacteroidota bacterium]
MAEDKTIPAFDYFDTNTDKEKLEKIAPYIVGLNLRNPANHGALIRLGANIRAKRVFFTSDENHFNQTKIKKSAGSSHTYMNFEFIKEDELFNRIPEDYTYIAIETSEKAKNLYQTKLPAKCVFIVGHESYGIPKEFLAKCDQSVFIPMPGHTKSLNVSHALSISIFEWFRQIFY